MHHSYHTFFSDFMPQTTSEHQFSLKHKLLFYICIIYASYAQYLHVTSKQIWPTWTGISVFLLWSPLYVNINNLLRPCAVLTPPKKHLVFVRNIIAIIPYSKWAGCRWSVLALLRNKPVNNIYEYNRHCITCERFQDCQIRFKK